MPPNPYLQSKASFNGVVNQLLYSRGNIQDQGAGWGDLGSARLPALTPPPCWSCPPGVVQWVLKQGAERLGKEYRAVTHIKRVQFFLKFLKMKKNIIPCCPLS